jgi:hypothetical protein
MTRRYLHDCEYADIGEIRAGMKEVARLKKNLYSNRIPFKTETINAPPLLPTKEATLRPDSGKGKAPLRASPHNADQGPPTRRKLEDRDRQGRIPLDYRLVQRNQSPPQNTPQNRYVDFDGTVYPGDPARDRANHSGPMTDRGARDKYDNSFRDKSMSSDRSRDSRPREGATEKIGPSRNRDPRERDEQRDRSYSSLQRAPSPTRGRGAKGKGARAPSTASAFPKFCAAPIEILTRAKALRHLGIVVTLAGTAQYPWVLRQSRYCGYCRWVLQGTVGTARAKVTVGYCGSTRGYCRVLWVLRVLGTVRTVGVYCRVYRKLELRVLYATLTGIETGYEIS